MDERDWRFARTNSFGESGCNDEALAGVVRATSSRIVAQTRVLRAPELSRERMKKVDRVEIPRSVSGSAEVNE